MDNDFMKLYRPRPSFLDELAELAEAHGFTLKFNFLPRVKYAEPPHEGSDELGAKHDETNTSRYGEKTVNGIINKMHRKVPESLAKGQDYTILRMTDLKRVTDVLEDIEHAPFVMDNLKKRFHDAKGERPFNDERCYDVIRLGTLAEGGFSGEINIVSVMQGIVDDFTYQLRAKQKEMQLQGDTEGVEQLDEVCRYVYKRLQGRGSYQETDKIVFSKILDFGQGPVRSDPKALPPKLVKCLAVPPYKIKNNAINFDEVRLEDQAHAAHEHAMKEQVSFLAVNQENFSIYEKRLESLKKRKGHPIEAKLTTKKQKLMHNRLDDAIEEKMLELSKKMGGGYVDYFNEHYHPIMANIVNDIQK